MSGGDTALPFIAQMPRGKGRSGRPIYNAKSLHKSYGAIKRKCGIKRSLTPHDLRRTTARRVYEITRDLRVVQALLGHSDLTSTLWYLQDNLTTVELATLEQAKDGIENHLEFYNSKGTETIH